MLETCQYEGAPKNCDPIDMNGDGEYGVGDREAAEDPGIDDDYDGQTDEYDETCPGGCDESLYDDSHGDSSEPYP